MDNIIKLIQDMGLPYAYDHFEEGESPSPPFLVYVLPKRRDFKADGTHYFFIQEVRLELYTDKKDIQIEQQIERTLLEYGVCFEKSEVYIASEKLYEVLYTFDMEVKSWEIKSNTI